MRRRLAITSLILMTLMLVPLAGRAESAPLPVTTTKVKLGTDELPEQAGPRSPASPGGVRESTAVRVPAEFDMIGVTWEGQPNKGHGLESVTDGAVEDVPEPGNAMALVRTSGDGETWSEWVDLTKETDLPDPSTDESRNQQGAAGPTLVGDSRHVQVQWDAGDKPRDLPTLHLIDTKSRGASTGQKAKSFLKGIFGVTHSPARASSGQPPIISRAAWGADESIRRGDPGYGTVRAGAVHHTVNSNSYSCSSSAAMIRGIYSFHVNGNGWNDIGYNFVVDNCGQIFEGRYGGTSLPVIGAHAYNYNYVTTGVALLGDFSSAGVPGAMYNGLVSILDWKLDVHHVNPLWQSTLTSYDQSEQRTVRNVSGHRDFGGSACPGNGAYGTLNSVAGNVYNAGGQKIFAPGANPASANWDGSKFGPINLTGYLKSAAAWTLRIFDADGGEVKSFNGSSDSVSTWWDGNADIGQPVLEGNYSFRIETPGASPAIGYFTLVGGHRFQEYLLAYNPSAQDTDVTITLMSNSGVVGTPVLHVPAMSRQTIDINRVRPWMELSARADSPVPVLMERAMYFNFQASMDDGSAGFGATAPATDWYFAEGYTAPGFFEYLTLQNPNPFEVTSTIRYLFNPSGELDQPLLLPANSRTTVDVNSQVGPGKELATHVTATGPIVVERPQYYVFRGQRGGDNVMGANALSTEWNFAEGYTGPGFATYVTLGNPGGTDATATLTFFGNSGVIATSNQLIKAGGRTTVDVNGLVGPNMDVSTKVVSDQPIIAERPVYFGYMGGRDGGHVALGNPGLQSHYDFAEGYTGTGFDEYLTVLNPDSNPLTVSASYAFKSDPPLAKVYVIPPNTRQTIAVHNEVNRIGDVSVSLDGDHPFAVERPMYFSFRGAWKGGSVTQGGPGPSTTWYFAEGYTG